MRAKRFLEQFRVQTWKVRRLEAEIQAINDEFSFSQDMTSDKVQSSPKPDRIGEIIAKKSDKIEEMWSEVDKAQELMEEIEAVIEQVSKESLKFLLVERYINFKTWSVMEREMGFNSNGRWVHKLHGRALNEVERIINGL